MSRVSVALSAAVFVLAITTQSAKAIELTSESSTITSIGQSFSFDFRGDSDLASLNSSSSLTGILVGWTFTPAGGAAGDSNLIADLIIPAAGGDDTGVGFNTHMNLANGTVTGFASNIATSQLVFSDTVIGGLLAGNGVINGALSILNTNIPALNSFFTGNPNGSISATLGLVFQNGGPGGNGGQVPEPGALAMWGVICAAALLTRRRLGRPAH